MTADTWIHLVTLLLAILAFWLRDRNSAQSAATERAQMTGKLGQIEQDVNNLKRSMEADVAGIERSMSSTFENGIARFELTFRESLRRELSVEYLGTKLAEAQMRPLAESIAGVSRRLDEVEDYAHEAQHSWRNELQVVRGEVQEVERRLVVMEDRMKLFPARSPR